MMHNTFMYYIITLFAICTLHLHFIVLYVFSYSSSKGIL